MKIIDDVMPVVMQDQLLDICTDPSFQWSFMPDSTYDKRQERIVGDMNKPSYPSMSHLAMNKFQTKTSTANLIACLLYTSPSPRDNRVSRMPSSA